MPEIVDGLWKRIMRGASWSTFGGVLSRIVLLGAWVVVGRILGPEAFGEVGIVLRTVEVAGLLATLGLGLTANRHIAALRNSNEGKARELYSWCVKLGTISGLSVACIALLGAGVTAEQILGEKELQLLLQIVAVVIAVRPLREVYGGTLRGLEQFSYEAVGKSIGGLVQATGLIVGASVAGAVGALCGWTVGRVVEFAVFRNLLNRRGISTRKVSLTNYRGLFSSFALPALLSGAIVAPVDWACSAILVNIPDGFHEMGLYNAANHWRSAVMFIPATASAALLPVFTTEASEGKLNLSLLWLSLALATSLALLVAVPVWIAAKPLMELYGSQYSDGGDVVRRLVVVGVLFVVNTVLGKYLEATNRMWWALTGNIIWAAIVLVAFATVYIANGAKGLATSFLVGYGALNIFYVGVILVGGQRSEAHEST